VEQTIILFNRNKITLRTVVHVRTNRSKNGKFCAFLAN